VVRCFSDGTSFNLGPYACSVESTWVCWTVKLCIQSLEASVGGEVHAHFKIIRLGNIELFLLW